MKLGSIATLASFRDIQFQTSRLQSAMIEAQKEVVEGVLADKGLSLGSGTGQTTEIERSIEEFKQLNVSNTRVTSNLDVTQLGLTQLNSLSDSLLSVVGLDPSGSAELDVLKKSAHDTLLQAIDAMNTQVNGVYVFGGINADTPPMADYENGPGQAAFDTAFQSFFGFAKTDPAVSSITGAQMQDFLNNTMAPIFDGAGWNAAFSNASDDLTTVRIGAGVSTDLGASGNEQAMRDLIAAASMTFELSNMALGGEARRAASDFAISRTGSASQGLARLQSEVGLAQEKVAKQTEANRGRLTVLNELLVGQVGVDQYEASTRLTVLMTQLEASYSTTARLQQLSLLRYL